MFSDGPARDRMYEPFWGLEYAEMQGGQSFFTPHTRRQDEKKKQGRNPNLIPPPPSQQQRLPLILSICFCVCGFCYRPLCTLLFLINI